MFKAFYPRMDLVRVKRKHLKHVCLKVKCRSQEQPLLRREPIKRSRSSICTDNPKMFCNSNFPFQHLYCLHLLWCISQDKWPAGVVRSYALCMAAAGYKQSKYFILWLFWGAHLCSDTVHQSKPESKLSDVGSHHKTHYFSSIFKLNLKFSFYHPLILKAFYQFFCCCFSRRLRRLGLKSHWIQFVVANRSINTSITKLSPCNSR